MKIYVVMKGEYSDRHVVCVTLNKEVAEAMAKRFTEYESEPCYIDEFEDAAEFVETRKVYRVIFLKDGSHKVTEMNDYDDYEWQKACNKEIGDCIWWDKAIWAYCFADNAEHAFKIACDRRAKYLAEKEGII